MSVTEKTDQLIPVGTWKSDPVHSTVGFTVKHLVVATFRGKFTDYEATLVGGEEPKLTGTVKVASIATEDENQQGHLQSPDFFDAERYPGAQLRSTSIRRDGETFERRRRADAQGRDQAGHRDRHDRRPGQRPVRRRAARADPRDDDRPHRVRDRLERTAPGRRRSPSPTRSSCSPSSSSSRSSRRADPRDLRQPASRLVQHPAPPRSGASSRRRASSWSSRRASRDAALQRDLDVEPAPAAVQDLRKRIAAADAVLIATPEYNGSMPGQLKTAIDWASRPFPGSSLRTRWLRSREPASRPTGRCGHRPTCAGCSASPAPAWSARSSPSPRRTSASTTKAARRPGTPPPPARAPRAACGRGAPAARYGLDVDPHPGASGDGSTRGRSVSHPFLPGRADDPPSDHHQLRVHRHLNGTRAGLPALVPVTSLGLVGALPAPAHGPAALRA